jgi:uncharacterized protein YndB with AHSA1/START domain
LKASEEPFVIEQTFNASVDAVWSAITAIDQMREWYFSNIPAFEPEVGFETEFLVTSEGREFPHHWKVTEAVPAKKIAYEWTYENYPGRGLVTFELSQRADETTLTLTNTVPEDFPDTIPEFQRESCMAGWEYFIQRRLTEYLSE